MKETIPLWQRLQKHEEEVRAILKEDGCMDSQNRLRSWYGKQTDDKLKEAGHTSLSFDKCACHED